MRDRLLHHAIYRILYPYFDVKFVFDSYSCRNFKGTHKAGIRFVDFALKTSRSNKRTCWVIKCDVRKFFASIDQPILIKILKKYLHDQDTLQLLESVIISFYSTAPGMGLPLGNLTSQLLVNIYMNEFDQYMKHELKQKYYIRYADDFVIFGHDRASLLEILPKINEFLLKNLKLNLHPGKVFIKTVSSGVDFLGWVHFSDHRVLRTSTKRRMFKNLKANSGRRETLQSYLGMINHGNTRKLKNCIENLNNFNH